MWRVADVFISPCLCVHRREKADVTLISYNFGQHAGSFPDDARVDSSRRTERYSKITVVSCRWNECDTLCELYRGAYN
jgi:hypothetical protein